MTVYKRRADLQQEASGEPSRQRKNIRDLEETLQGSSDKPPPRSDPPRYASAVGTRVSPISLASSPAKPPSAPVEVAQLLRPGARLNAIIGMRAPTSDERLENHVRIPDTPEGRARMEMWKAEGWGDDPLDVGKKFGKEDYVTKSDYPFGLSYRYTGHRHGVRGFPQITLQSAYRMLLLGGDDCSYLVKLLKGEIKSLLMESDIRNKLAVPVDDEEEEDEDCVASSSRKQKPSKSKSRTREEKEKIRKANDEAAQRWDEFIVAKVRKYKFLPPPVRNEFIYAPVSLKYGRSQVIYTQASRCYFHCLDRIALEVAEKLRTEERIGAEEYESLCRFRRGWRDEDFERHCRRQKDRKD